MLIIMAKSGTGSSIFTILAVIILLAIISLSLVIVLVIKRRKRSSYLRDDYYEAYERIVLILENSTLSVFERGEVILDISDLLFQAQENDRPISSVIKNNDIDDFVKKIRLSYGYRNTVVFNILSGIQNMLFVLVIVQLAIFLVRNTDTFFQTTMGLMILPYLFFLSFILLPLIRYLISRQKIIWFIVALVGFVLLFIGSNEILHRFGSDIAWVQTYFDKEITIISSWYIAIALIFVFAASWLLKWFMRHQSIKKMKAVW
jgi:DNA-binding ferritin-like protein (Dps family)